MNLATLTICALATFRLTRLVMVEDGPFNLALKLRGRLDPDQKTWVGRGMACPWCISFWIGLVVVYVANYQYGLIAAYGLAASALVGLGYTACQHGLIIAERLTRARR